MSQILNFWEATGGMEGDEREREKKESGTEMEEERVKEGR